MAERMKCGCDPRVEISEADREVMDAFKMFLEGVGMPANFTGDPIFTILDKDKVARALDTLDPELGEALSQAGKLP